MRHRSSKIKFKQGKDANKMMLRKLSVNFLKYGKIVTTEARAKILKSHLDRLLEKTKTQTHANDNYLLKNLMNKGNSLPLYERVGSVIKDKSGGYIKIKKLTQRVSDGAYMSQLEWTYPILNTAEELKKPAEIKTVK